MTGTNFNGNLPDFCASGKIRLSKNLLVITCLSHPHYVVDGSVNKSPERGMSNPLILNAMQKREEEQMLAHPMEVLTSREKLLAKNKADIAQYCLDPDDEYPTVYVGTYRKYNEGSLYGAWIDLTACYDYDEFMEVCHKLHADESEPELMFQDFMYFPERWYAEGSFSEEKFDKIMEWWTLDDKKKEAYEKFMWLFGEEDIEKFNNAYVGKYTWQEDFAKVIIAELHPEVAHSDMERFFNYEKYAQELFESDFTWEKGYVFKNNF